MRSVLVQTRFLRCGRRFIKYVIWLGVNRLNRPKNLSCSISEASTSHIGSTSVAEGDESFDDCDDDDGVVLHLTVSVCVTDGGDSD